MENINESVVNNLINIKASISTCESCTGGLIASSIVDVAGASWCFNEGYITYSNEAKQKNAFVSSDTLLKYGAVSSQTASEMAEGIRRQASATFGVASTGIAGPDGGTKEKPVGLVYIACSFGDKTFVRRLQLDGNRQQVRDKACKEALKLVLDCIEIYKEQM